MVYLQKILKGELYKCVECKKYKYFVGDKEVGAYDTIDELSEANKPKSIETTDNEVKNVKRKRESKTSDSSTVSE